MTPLGLYKESEVIFMEKCTNCERSIGNLEQVYVYQNQHVVCSECSALLMAGNTHIPTTKTEEKLTISTTNEALQTKRMFCANCGYGGNPIKVVKGSFFIELILWIFFLIPGLIYSIWRLTTKALVCPKCKTPNMVPLSTPKGQLLLEESRQHSNTTPNVIHCKNIKNKNKGEENENLQTNL